jgi:hypothetical protein
MDIWAWGFEPSFIQVRVVYGRPDKGVSELTQSVRLHVVD